MRKLDRPKSKKINWSKNKKSSENFDFIQRDMEHNKRVKDFFESLKEGHNDKQD